MGTTSAGKLQNANAKFSVQAANNWFKKYKGMARGTTSAYLLDMNDILRPFFYSVEPQEDEIGPAGECDTVCLHLARHGDDLIYPRFQASSSSATTWAFPQRIYPFSSSRGSWGLSVLATSRWKNGQRA